MLCCYQDELYIIWEWAFLGNILSVRAEPFLVIIASIVEFVRNQNAIRSYDRASSFVLRLKSKLRCGLEGDLFYQPWMAETTTAMIATLAGLATSLSILLYDKTVGRRILYRMRPEGASRFGTTWLATYPQSPEGIFLRPHPILSLNLGALS